jgi:hypothetical protein
MPTLWGGGGGLRARPEGMPRVGEPKEKELCAGPSAPLGYVIPRYTLVFPILMLSGF